MRIFLGMLLNVLRSSDTYDPCCLFLTRASFCLPKPQFLSSSRVCYTYYSLSQEHAYLKHSNFLKQNETRNKLKQIYVNYLGIDCNSDSSSWLYCKIWTKQWLFVRWRLVFIVYRDAKKLVPFLMLLNVRGRNISLPKILFSLNIFCSKIFRTFLLIINNLSQTHCYFIVFCSS